MRWWREVCLRSAGSGPASTTPRIRTCRWRRPRNKGCTNSICFGRAAMPGRFISGAYRGRLERHALRARHQVEFELYQFRRAELIRLRPDAEDAAAQAALQRAERLPLQPVHRVAGGMGLRDRGARKALVPIVVVAIGAGQIELALPPRKELTPLGDEGFKLRIVAGRNRNAARLLGDENGEREEVAALESKWFGLLMPRAFQIDARFEIDRVAQLLVEGRIARRHAFHGGAGVAMAIRAGLVRRALFLLPQGFA